MADSRNRGLIDRIEMLEAKVDAAYLRGFSLGATYGIFQTTLNLMVAQSDAILSLLQRRFEKEQMEREHFNAILSRRSMNLRWWDMLPTAPAGPSPLR